MKWDGYIHINGKMIVKPIWNGESMIERDSPFVKQYLEPVEAESRDEAALLLSDKIKI